MRGHMTIYRYWPGLPVRGSNPGPIGTPTGSQFAAKYGVHPARLPADLSPNPLITCATPAGPRLRLLASAWRLELMKRGHFDQGVRGPGKMVRIVHELKTPRSLVGRRG